MNDSDQSDKETQDQAIILNASDDSTNNEPAQKRPREDASEDEELELPSKRLCAPMDKITPRERETKRVLEVNGTMEDTKERGKNINSYDKDINSTSVLKGDTSKSMKEIDAKSSNKNQGERVIDDVVIKKEDKNQDRTDEECKVL